jgi:hypothetical protein
MPDDTGNDSASPELCPAGAPSPRAPSSKSSRHYPWLRSRGPQAKCIPWLDPAAPPDNSSAPSAPSTPPATTGSTPNSPPAPASPRPSTTDSAAPRRSDLHPEFGTQRHGEHRVRTGNFRVLGFGAVDQAVNAILDDRHIEVDEEPDPQFREAQIGQDLTVMDGLQCFHGLQFHNHLSAYQ